MGYGVWGEAEKRKSPELEAGVRNPGWPWAGAGAGAGAGREGGRQNQCPLVQVGGTGAQRGAGAESRSFRKEDTHLDFTEGKLSLEEEFCVPPHPPLHRTHLGVEGLWLACLGLVV